MSRSVRIVNDEVEEEPDEENMSEGIVELGRDGWKAKSIAEELEYEDLRVAAEKVLQDAYPEPPLTIEGRTNEPNYVYLEERDISVHERILGDRPDLFRGGRAGGPVSTMEVVDACLKAIKPTISPGSHKSYGGCWRTFAKKKPIFPTTPEAIEDYTDTFTNLTTARDVHTKLGILYKFASERFGLPNVMKLVKKARPKESEKPALTLEQARAVVNACRDDRELGLIHLYLGHGWRLDEACRLDVDDITDGQAFIHGKTREEFEVVLTETEKLLLGLGNSEPGPQVFTSQLNKRLAAKTAYVIVKGILYRAGVLSSPKEKGYSTHSLRHTFSTLSQEAGMDYAACQRLMRHSKRSETERYTHLSKDYLRSQLERYSPLRLINGSPQKLDKIYHCISRNVIALSSV